MVLEEKMLKLKQSLGAVQLNNYWNKEMFCFGKKLSKPNWKSVIWFNYWRKYFRVLERTINIKYKPSSSTKKLWHKMKTFNIGENLSISKGTENYELENS